MKSIKTKIILSFSHIFKKSLILEIPIKSYEMAFFKTSMLIFILKTDGFINILKASFCHSSLLKDNKNFNLFKKKKLIQAI